MKQLSVTKVMSGQTIICYEFSNAALKELLDGDMRSWSETLMGCKSSIVDDVVSIPANCAGTLIANAKRYGVQPVVTKQKNLSGQAIGQTTEQKLAAAGFKRVYVTGEEHEDGVGAGPGVNYVKNGVWYTETEAKAEVK